MSLTGQERVMQTACAIEAWKFVRADPTLQARLDTADLRVRTGEVAALTGLPLAVVDAAMQNLADAGLMAI